MLRTYRNLPPIVSGYPLDEAWSVVVPIARTNLCQNPSFETNTTSWTAIGGSIARSTSQQYHGAYSLAITPTAATTDGARYDTVSLTSGTTYAYSAKIRGVAGLKYKLAVETTGGVELAGVTFTATGRWQWIVGYYTETSSTTRRVCARKAAHTSVAIFYLDGVQVEAIASGELASTYCDGDQQGLVPNQSPPAYFWNGTPHASTSTRSAQTRAGGMVIPFKKYGFLITAIIGLGMAGVQNVATDYARIDGAYDDYTRKPPRQFTVTGRFQGRTYAELRRNRSGLAQLFDRDLTGQDQCLTLLRHVEDSYGRILTSETRHLVKYESGFGGNTDNMHAENVPITFTQYLPNILADGEDGESLAVQLSVTNDNDILQRSPSGTWSALSTGMNGGVQSLALGLDGKLYAGGTFTTSGGTTTNGIAVWNGTAWAAMGTTGLSGGTASARAIAVAPNGDIYVAGNFTLAGGVANTAFIAKWNGSAWSALSTGADGTISALAFAPDGTLYAGGNFANIGGVAAARIAKWNGTVWSALSTGANNIVQSLIVAPGGTLYVGGDFTTLGGVTVNGIGKWNGSAFTAMGTGVAGGLASVLALRIAQNGTLYMGGNFTSVNGIAAAYAASWNGVQWSALGTGMNGFVEDMVIDASGLLYAIGSFTTAGGITVPDAMAVWNGSAWTLLDVDLSGTPAVGQALLIAPDGTLTVGHNNTGTATAAGITTVTNLGTAKAYPTITITGPSSGTSRIYILKNNTTNRAIYLNLTLNAGETAKLVFQPDNLSFTSDFQGDIASSILSGSNEADFFLRPGANSIAFLSASSTVTATIQWRPAYVSMDDVQ